MSKPKRWTRSADDDPLLEEAAGKPEKEEVVSAVESDLRQVLSRARLLIIVFIAIAFIVVFRLVAWQMTPESSAAAPVQRAEDNSRGRIVDTTGLLLATDDFSWEVYVRKAQLESMTNRPSLLAEISAILGISDAELRDQLARAEGNLLIVARNVPEAQCKAIDGLDEAGAVWCAARRHRVYPQNELAAHVVGFANLDQKGVTGVEGAYDAWLRSAARTPFEQMPGHAEALPDDWRTYLPSPGGRDLVLHISAPLQFKVEQRLGEAIIATRAESGSIIVMNPRTGGILAMANWPSYDLNKYGLASQATLRNAAVEFSYEPGSVFKLITFAAGLDSGQITPDTLFDDSGKLEVDGRLIQNAEKRRYGKITATDALAKSVNTVSAQMALQVGPESFYRYVGRFGFGKPTEADVVYEDSGVVKRWGTYAFSRFDQATNSFGQAISVTPLQLACGVSAIANGGVLLQPQIVEAVVKDDTLHRLPPRVMGQAIKPETARTLTRMMVTAVESYSIKNLLPGFRVAGKTGTAEIPTEQGYTSELTITSFVGFLPAADPQVLILIKLDKPKKSKWAETVTLPVFQQVARDTVQVLKIEPDDRMP